MKEQTSVQELIKKNNNNKGKVFADKAVPIVLLLIASVSVLTTIGILFTLLTETVTFFTRVNPMEFLLSKEWAPFSSDPKYGIFSLILGTLKVTAVATVFAVPVGLGAALYLSEYASDKSRRIIKPILEILAGIPTIVYGFFALTFVTPILRSVFPELGSFNSISPGLVVGVMIIPMITSMSEDAMSSVPDSIKEGALGLGATKFELATKIVFPAALSGIIASIVLAISRAIGETMIVSLAAGSTPDSSFSLIGSIQTMTGFIVQVATGDATYGSDIYYSIYAVGFTLFLFTFIMNIISQWVTKRFREEY
ncbi:phosphate ABC transporter permease [Mammaliicoccus lentus]|mgnify:CR=1 FL=1|jgi:phosphate transport system permease protein|uniref:Phosphate transport system permease protein n=1 Tax=Mammaliicoccus lentus TaxID=42858 RepID=A0AAX3VZS3_MAMLE|nr:MULTISPECIES: phosphate ABC transporter permease subunit PstC [Mammaliicoccus]HBV03828.1 phosphate ABC transporter permease subunit PstC [Staphylococcus sp.]MBF0747917.1 phosphate ABC transporter permease subunit PstC [Mammaliicoccus lentus]MBF0793270.1 phosphate ABC transporter permease subunit PstC [Mammaliicoccus lentus]MBW0761628.1 phosphate ABC transporter permease subunit PstC [Mammaliicoccus lentus]MBW0769925.1 phosphate ABC transporter permease subunit PstC [Mammaliicoccus lentus]